MREIEKIRAFSYRYDTRFTEHVNKINNRWIKIVMIVSNNGIESIILSVFPYLYFGIRWSSAENRSLFLFSLGTSVLLSSFRNLHSRHGYTYGTSRHTIGHDFAPVVVFISMWISHWRQLDLVGATHSFSRPVLSACRKP